MNCVMPVQNTLPTDGVAIYQHQSREWHQEWRQETPATGPIIQLALLMDCPDSLTTYDSRSVVS